MCCRSVDRDSNFFEALGGIKTCHELSVAFYARVAQDPVLRPLFPSSSFRCAIEALTAFLVQFLGGPCEYSQRRWSLSLREAHQRFKIGAQERDAWMKNMVAALEDVRIAAPARDVLHGFFEQASADMVNRPAAPCSVKSSRLDPEIAGRWNVHQQLEEAVAAVRRGDAQGAIALAANPDVQNYFRRDRAAWLSLLAIMSGAVTEYVRGKLLADPGLAQERYTYGRTLLHETAGQGSLATVELLLELGADPNAADQFGHVPLYFVGNQCHAATGPEVVRALVRGGANVNARGGVQRCTALHMAARRGNVRVAEALLACGADIEARDKRGDTPLDRAVNCRKKEMAAFFTERGSGK